MVQNPWHSPTCHTISKLFVLDKIMKKVIKNSFDSFYSTNSKQYGFRQKFVICGLNLSNFTKNPRLWHFIFVEHSTKYDRNKLQSHGFQLHLFSYIQSVYVYMTKAHQGSALVPRLLKIDIN